VFIPPEKRDTKLGKKLQGEASGILNWMLDGLSRWIERGLVLPDKVKAATQQWRDSSDQLGRFLKYCCEMAPPETDPEDKSWRAQSSQLLAVHNAWARAGGGTEWRQKGFTDAMSDRGFEQTKSSVMFFIGLRLMKSIDDFEGDDGRPRSSSRDGELTAA
jgi:putative DNA primase/helicase